MRHGPARYQTVSTAIPNRRRIRIDNKDIFYSSPKNHVDRDLSSLDAGNGVCPCVEAHVLVADLVYMEAETVAQSTALHMCSDYEISE